MTIQEIINKWLGKSVDTDGAYGPQCMDWMHQFIYDYTGNTNPQILAAPAAKDVYLNYDNMVGRDLFERIGNTPTNFPLPGDIVFWNTHVGPYGHVAIVESADKNKMVVIEQNWNGVQKVTRRTSNYDGVMGWLRYKATSVPTNPTPPSNSTSTSPLEAKASTYTNKLNQYKDKLNYTYYMDDWGRIVDDVIKYKNSNEVLEGNNKQLATNIDALIKAHAKELSDKEIEFERNLSNLDKALLKETQRADKAEKALKDHVCPTWYSGLLQGLLQAIEDVKSYLEKKK